jgi:L-ascorbate metabolism protein UlaG (beta-lactamase superfamily)
MKNPDQLLIQVENEVPKEAIVLITDDHAAHLKGHLRFFWKFGMLRHIFIHIKLKIEAKRKGIPVIHFSEVLKASLNAKKPFLSKESVDTLTKRVK